MKNLASILLITLFMSTSISCLHSQGVFIKLDQSKTDQTRIELATKIASGYFNAMQAGGSFDFSTVASKEFTDQMTPEVQKQSYQQVRAEFGEFKSLSYVSTWVKKDAKDYYIMRFKGSFENSQEPLEIRVVMDNSKKVIGFWIKPWVDDLNQA